MPHPASIPVLVLALALTTTARTAFADTGLGGDFLPSAQEIQTIDPSQGQDKTLCLAQNCGIEPLPFDQAYESVLTVEAEIPPIEPVVWKGDPDCRVGEPDCNVCAPDVRGQFRSAAARANSRTSDTWRFRWDATYSPSRLTPFETFDGDDDSANWAGVSGTHVQGFVRTNSPVLAWAGSHSQKGDREGTVFVTYRDSAGGDHLTAIHETHSRHPSGVQVLGKYLVFGDRSGPRDWLRVIDLDRAWTASDIRHLVQHPGWTEACATQDPRVGPCLKEFGGGIAMARLRDGSYMLLSSTPGDRKEEAKFHRVYRVTGDLEDPSSTQVRLFLDWEYTQPSTWSRDFRHSENVSLVTECDTGTIYAIHSSGDGEAADGLFGAGYWRLTELLASERGGLGFVVRDAFTVSQDWMSCHMRAAATVTVLDDGVMQFTCHEYGREPDPAVLMPIPIRAAPRMLFQTWTAR